MLERMAPRTCRRRGSAVWRAAAALVVVLTFFAGLLSAQHLPGPDVTGTKTVSGTFTPGGAVTYMVNLTNNGGLTQPDNPGHEFVDVLPASLTLVSATASSGAAVATFATNTVTWDGTIPAGDSRAIRTILVSVVLTPPGCRAVHDPRAISLAEIVSNQGAIFFDADANGTNETNRVTDDPGTAAPNDPTAFTVGPPVVTATKTASGSFIPGGSITYTAALTNFGFCTLNDNPGNEFVDVLPASLTLVSSTATSGTAVATLATNTVTWNGSIPSSGSVTITIQATVNAGTVGQTISNQGTCSYDSDGNDTNDADCLTDDPAIPGAGDPTSVTIAGVSPIAIPTLSEIGLALLCLALASAALLLLRRRQPA